MSAPDRRAKVERAAKDLSVRRQCAVLNAARSGVYRAGPALAIQDSPGNPRHLGKLKARSIKKHGSSFTRPPILGQAPESRTFGYVGEGVEYSPTPQQDQFAAN
jgi:hypothetical protein